MRNRPRARRGARWKRTLPVLLLLAVLASARASGTAQPDENSYLCGPRCLCFCARRLGVRAELTHLANLSGAQPGRGASLGALSQAARELGLEARCYSLDLEDLLSINPATPAIAPVDGNHFVVVWTDHEGELTVVDPPAEPYTQALTQFGRRWNGAAVVVSRPGEQPHWGLPYVGLSFVAAGAVLLLAAVVRIAHGISK
ncbi:MAG: cysteine peptidase family C39 domain-containing protein [Candidatus Brocadiia bacterium]